MSALEKNREFSQGKIEELVGALAPQSETFPNLTIYATGSLGRLEANRNSDLDAFFVFDDLGKNEEEIQASNEGSHLKQIQLFSDIIGINLNLGFPGLSNDGQYLEILSLNKMLEQFGAPADDYDNLFTARMLLLLESRSICNKKVYDKVIDAILASYYRDFPDHKDDFEPTILMNDITRFWKTLCLNFENRRNSEHDPSPEKKLEHDRKRVKLKFSRMLTCFATIIAVAAIGRGVKQAQVREICARTPLERINTIFDNGSFDEAQEHVNIIEGLYGDFLEYCEQKKPDRKSVERMLKQDDAFAEATYETLQCVASQPPANLRRIVV